MLKGNLSGWIAVGEGGDEYDQIAQNINAMLDRIQRLIATVRGVTENIAHDLRTPLNRLRSRLEVALMSPRSEEEYRAVLKRAISESETIVETFNGILKIARIKAGALLRYRARPSISRSWWRSSPISIRLSPRRAASLLKQKYPRLAFSKEASFVLSDARLISQAAANLLDNAIKYSPKGGKVVIAAAQTADGVSLTITDSGPGIRADKRTAILDRFVRLDLSRRQTGLRPWPELCGGSCGMAWGAP